MHSTSRIYFVGHSGLIGAAVVRRLGAAGFSQLQLRTHECYLNQLKTS